MSLEPKEVLLGMAAVAALATPGDRLPSRVRHLMSKSFVHIIKNILIVYVVTDNIKVSLLAALMWYMLMRALADPVETTENHIPEDRGLKVSEDLARKMRGDGGVVHE
jgi:hypothetical protein